MELDLATPEQLKARTRRTLREALGAVLVCVVVEAVGIALYVSTRAEYDAEQAVHAASIQAVTISNGTCAVGVCGGNPQGRAVCDGPLPCWTVRVQAGWDGCSCLRTVVTNALEFATARQLQSEWLASPVVLSVFSAACGGDCGTRPPNGVAANAQAWGLNCIVAALAVAVLLVPFLATCHIRALKRAHVQQRRLLPRSREELGATSAA